MSTEQLISSVEGSSWGDIGEELEEGLSSGNRYWKKRGKKNNEKKQVLIKGGQKGNRSVGSVAAQASTSKVPQQEGIAKEEEGFPNKSLEFFKKVNHEMEGKLESKKASEASLVNAQSKIDSRLDRRAHVIGSNPRIGNDEDLQKRFVEKSPATEGKQGEQMTLIRNISADKRQLEKSEEGERSGFFGSSDYKQAIDDAAEENIKVAKRGSVSEGKFTESSPFNEGTKAEGETDFDYQSSLGDVPDMKMDLSSELKDDLNRDDADFSLQGDVPDMERFERKEGTAEASEKVESAKVTESLEELQERVDRLKNGADAARNLLFSCRRKNGDRWKEVKKFFAFPKGKEAPKSVIEEWEMLEVAWKYRLTLYKDARVELAKRQVAEGNSQGRDVGAVMAETIRELDFRGRVESYNAWKDAAWSGKKDSWLLRAVGRAKDWGESYRNLNWKKRAAISALVIGAGVTGVAVGSVGLIGLGAASGVAVRLLGSYAAGRGLYEYLEGRANKDTVKFQEAVLSHVEQFGDIGFLDHRTRDYADRIQKDFEQMTRKNRKRVWAGVAAGALLFAGGTAFSLAHAASAAERIVDGGSGKQVIQDALTARGAEIPEIPKNVPVPSVVEASVPASDTSGLMPDSIGSGVIDHGSSVEVAGDIGKSLADMEIAAVPRGGSFEGVLIEKLMGVGVAKEEAGKLAHRAMLDLAEKSGKPFEIFNDIQPSAEIQYEIGPDKSLSVFGVTREAGGRAIQRIADSTLEGGHASSAAQTLKESLLLSPKQVDAVPAPSVQMLSHDPFPKMPEVNLESPQDIFERVLPKVPQVPSLGDTLSGNVPLDASVSEHIPSASVPVPEVAVAPDQVVSSFEPLDSFDKYAQVAAGVGAGAAVALGGGALAGLEIAKARKRSRDEGKNEQEKEGRIALTQEERAEMKRKSGSVFDQVISLSQQNFPDDRKKALRRIREGYAAFSEASLLKDDIFDMTQENIKTVFFGSTSVSEKLLAEKFSNVVARDRVAGLGVKNAYVIFQSLFLRVGERLPGNIVDRSVGEVLRLITERFLTGQVPEELHSSKS